MQGMSEYIDSGICNSHPDALLAAFRDVDALVGAPDYAVTFCCSPWPDGGWLAGFRLDDKGYADEQELETRFLPEDTSYAAWDVFNGFAVGVNGHGSHLAEAIEEAVAKVREVASQDR